MQVVKVRGELMDAKLLKETVNTFAPVEVYREHKGLLEIDGDAYPNVSCSNCYHWSALFKICSYMKSLNYGQIVDDDDICLRWESKKE